MESAVYDGTALFIDGKGLFICGVCFTRFKRSFNAHRHVERFHPQQNAEIEQHNPGANDDDVDDESDNFGTNGSISPPTKVARIGNDVQKTNDIIATDDDMKKSLEELHREVMIHLAGKNYNNDMLSVSLNDSDIYEDISTDDDEDVVSSDDNELDLSDDWLYNNSRLSIKEHAAAVLGYSIRHNCSHQSINDLLRMLQIHIPEFNSAALSYAAINKLLAWQCGGDINIIEYCEECYAMWPDDVDCFECSTEGCHG